MTAAVVAFAAYLALGAVFAVFGRRTRRVKLYAAVEGALAAAGAVAAAVVFFTFGKLPGKTVPDPETVAPAKEVFGLFAALSAGVCAVAAILTGLSMLINAAEKKKPSSYIVGLWYASVLIGTAADFTMALYALRFSDGLAVPADGEIVVFALGCAFALRAVLSAAALILSHRKEKQ